jgi:hypothetical protein
MTGKLIGIGGKLTSGKDTVADFLVESHGWIKLNMSAPLHEAALVLNPWIRVAPNESPDLVSEFYTYEELTNYLGYTRAKEIEGYRAFLQRLGTEVGRDMFDKNLWTKIADRNIARLRQHGDNVVITGIRFPNEFEMIRNSRNMDGEGDAGLLLWVERPGLDNSSTTAGHASESLTSDGFDTTIVNNGTLEDLYKKTEKLL